MGGICEHLMIEELFPTVEDLSPVSSGYAWSITRQTSVDVSLSSESLDGTDILNQGPGRPVLDSHGTSTEVHFYANPNVWGS